MGWFSLVGTVLAIISKLLGIGKPDPVAEGEKAGQAEQRAASDDAILQDLAKGDAADRGVSDDPSGLRSNPHGHFRD